MANENTDVQKVVTPVCKVIFPNLLETEKFKGDDTGKYSVTLIIQPEDIKLFEEAVFKSNGGKGNNPVKAIPADAEYDSGCFKIKPTTKRRAKVIGKKQEPVSADLVTHGAMVRAAISFKAYTGLGGGVTAYLNTLQLLREGSGGDMDFGELPAEFADAEHDGADLPF